MSTVIRNSRRIFTGGDTALNTRIGILENSKLKITYFEEINTNSGTITIPTGATILLDQFQSGADAYVSTIQNSQPTGIFPKTSLGVTVDVASFDALGNFVLSGTPSAYPVALIYVLKISLKDYYNLNIDHILDEDEVSNIGYSQIGVGDSSNRLSGTDQFRIVYDFFQRPNMYLLDIFGNGITIGTSGTLSSMQSVGNLDLLLQAKTSSYINLGYQTDITYNSDFGIHIFNTNIQSNGQNISVIDNIAGSSVFLRAENTNLNGAAGIQLSSGAGATLAGFNTYTVGGNYAGTSLPITGTALIDSQSGAHPLVLMASEHINLVGDISTNYGTRLDVNGYRIGQLSTLHSANTYIFSVSNKFYFNSSDQLVLDNSHGLNRGISFYNANSGVDNLASLNYYPSSGVDVGSAFSISPKGTGYSSTIKSQIGIFNTDFVQDNSNYEALVIRAGGTDNYSFSSIKVGSTTVRSIWIDATGGQTAASANIHFLTTGGVRMNSLPTSNAGLSTGDLYISTAATILANGDKVVGIKV